MNLIVDQRIAVREHAARNHAEIMRSNACRCVACLQRFSPEDVVEWVSHRRDGSPVKIGELPKKRAELETASAICPMCGNLGVVGDASGFPLNDLELWQQL